MFRGNDDKTLQQRLQVQELVVRIADTQLYVVDSSDVIVKVGDALQSIVQVLFQDNSAGTLTPVAAASLSIVDKDSPYSAGGDEKAIRVASVTLAANDLLVVKYIAK